jgi:hypothetical protein
MGIRCWIIIRCLWNCNIFIRTAVTGGGLGTAALLAGAAVLLVAGTICNITY